MQKSHSLKLVIIVHKVSYSFEVLAEMHDFYMGIVIPIDFDTIHTVFEVFDYMQ